MEMREQSHQSLRLVQRFIGQPQVGRSQQLDQATVSANGKDVVQNGRGTGHHTSSHTVSYHQRASAGKVLNSNKGQGGETNTSQKGRHPNLNCIAHGSQLSPLTLIFCCALLERQRELLSSL